MNRRPSQAFWKDKKVLVTGGTGFIGSHVVENLVSFGSKVTVFDRMNKGVIKNIEYLKNKVKFVCGDCTNIIDAKNACKYKEIVLNLAAHVGGIEYNIFHQATMLRDNLLIATIMLDAALANKVERFLVVSSACVYPRECKIPTPETEGFIFEPEPTNGGYGWGKRMAEVLGRYYAQQFGMKVGIIRPYNCYGPRDNFDPKVSHVIPGLIKRVLNGENPVVVWGSGRQTRAFLYVEDLARGMILISGKKSKIKFDTSKPNGSPRRNSDNKKAKEKLGFQAGVSLTEGLKRTIQWYASLH